MKMKIMAKPSGGGGMTVPIMPPTNGGYYTNHDLQIVMSDVSDDDVVANVTFGHPQPSYRNLYPTDGEFIELPDSPDIVRFTTGPVNPNIVGEEGEGTIYRNYHFHKKKKIYVSGRIALMELTIKFQDSEWSGSGVYFIYSADFVPFKNSKFVGQKRVDGLLSSELAMSQAFVSPFDLKNPKVRITAKMAQSTAADYNLNDLYLVAVPANAHQILSGTYYTGEVLKKSREAGQMTYGSNVLIHVPISSEASGIAVSSKYINTKLMAGDKLFVYLDEDIESSGSLTNLSIDIEVEGEVLNTGKKPAIVRALFREGTGIIPSDLTQIFGMLS